ncbi:MAG: hypothetical protein OEL76_11415 [Siculibacillus sp.]|nr:hypothetical protein [Siculibacillus sp.]
MRTAAAALLATAAILLGAAHRPPIGHVPAFATALVLPDGTTADLCHGGADDDGAPAGDDRARGSCPACRLVDAPGLPAVDVLVLAPPSTTVVARLDRGSAALSGSLLPAPLSRGPPRRA